MSTFIERHGYVRYPVKGYNTPNICEVRGCAQREFERKLAQVFLAIDSMTYITRSDLPAQFKISHNEQRWARLVKDLTDPKSYLNRKKYVVDHCHQHGWVRGVVCQSCNNSLAILDAGKTYNAPPPTLASLFGITCAKLRLEEFRLNCPECAGEGNPVANKVTHEFLTKRLECASCGEPIVIALDDYDQYGDDEIFCDGKCLDAFYNEDESLYQGVMESDNAYHTRLHLIGYE
jgi:hypothetical protein